MKRMHNPPHPGAIIREVCLAPLNLSVTAAAEGLGITRKTLSELLNGRSGVSPDMVIRLAKAFGSTPEHWLAAGPKSRDPPPQGEVPAKRG